MKGVFLVFHGFAAHNGISKKIFDQLEAFHTLGAPTRLCYLTIDEQGNRKRMMGDEVLENYGGGLRGKLLKRVCYKGLNEYIRREGIDFIYMRSDHNANPLLKRWLGKQHKAGVKIVMEIPTYPYDSEYDRSPLKRKASLRMDQFFRKRMARYIDRIVTFSEYPLIFGRPTIRISNGINFDRIPLKSLPTDSSREIHLTGVADIHFWHGFDRVITGLGAYYAGKPERQVFFHIVGSGVPAELEGLRALTAHYGLQERIIFHGALSGEELDRAFDETHLGVASLGRHRGGISRIKTLKNREYAARGLPFVYSETDEDFDAMPYVWKAPADETPLDIAALLEFYDSLRLTPSAIRESVSERLPWTVQMGKVLHEIENL